MSRDAIEWMVETPDLLPLVPRVWMQTQMRQFRERVQDWRERDRRDILARCYPGYENEPIWRGDVDVGSGSAGASIITADGEIEFHKDPGFERYGYMLVVRDAGYSVTGVGKWRGMQRQPAGTLFCLHQERRKHALIRTGTPNQAALDTRRREGTYDRILMAPRPRAIWMAVGFNDTRLLSPDEAAQAMWNKLALLPINRPYRKTAA